MKKIPRFPIYPFPAEKGEAGYHLLRTYIFTSSKSSENHEFCNSFSVHHRKHKVNHTSISYFFVKDC